MARKPWEPAARIAQAARDVGILGELIELVAPEAAAQRRRIEEAFLHPSLAWWWERLKSGRSYWNETPGWNPVDVIADLSVDGPVWLLPVYDDKGEVFRAPMPRVVDILRHSRIDEFAVVADDLSWILMINHHDALFGAGERVTSRFEALERRPGGKGGPTPKHAAAPPPPLLDGARVLHYAISGRGGFYAITDEDGASPQLVAAMAICRYDSEKTERAYLFGCAADWEVISDGLWESVEECMDLGAQSAGSEAPLTWVEMKVG
jgi:hypothetical protein